MAIYALYIGVTTCYYPLTHYSNWDDPPVVGINNLEISTKTMAIRFQCLPTPARVINPSKGERLSNDMGSITEALEVGTRNPSKEKRGLNFKPQLAVTSY